MNCGERNEDDLISLVYALDILFYLYFIFFCKICKCIRNTECGFREEKKAIVIDIFLLSLCAIYSQIYV